MQRHLNQEVTYWSPGAASTTDLYGKPTSATPVVLMGRWEDRTEQIQSKTGEQFISKSRVFLEEEVSIDGYVMLGEFADADPSGLDGAREIQQVARQPDLRGMRSLTVVYL